MLKNVFRRGRVAAVSSLWKTKPLLLCVVMLAARELQAAEPSPALVELQKHSFFHGREYFVLRSGRAQMILQQERADIGPALTYLLFNAENPAQSTRKQNAFNFDPQRGAAASTLVVNLGGFPFTALGHRTEMRWVLQEGIPAVEAVWWAGGVRVTEHFTALEEANAFRRTIQLEGANLAGEEQVTLRLSLPPGTGEMHDKLLLHLGKGAQLALGVADQTPSRVDATNGWIEIGPVSVPPARKDQTADPSPAPQTISTLLFVQTPAGDKGALISQAQAACDKGAAAEIARTRDHWAQSGSVSTADRTVQELFDKARFGLPGMIAGDGAMNAGIFEYGAQWVRDTSNTALGALHAGHFDLARRALARMLTKMISKEGVTMIAGGFDAPDLEQFDQMGELTHLLRTYRDWTGDDSLVREHRELLLALIERPLKPQFRDDTGMMHNRREFWERTFEDGYELAYQTYVILGLREAVELAPSLQAEDRVPRWREEAGRIQKAMLEHPARSLVDQGRLIKRRNLTGEVANDPARFTSSLPDVPLHTEKRHFLMPDASQALPIALGLLDGRSDLARKTLDQLEELWNARWSDGGYDRYHTSGQPDQPGPWSFATCFILRAQHEAGQFERSRRSLEYLNTVQGGRAGAWFEEIPSVRSLTRSCGVLPWTSGEIALFVVRHYLGVRFENGAPVIRPALYPGSPPVTADLRFRQGRLRLEITGSGPVLEARVNGALVKPRADNALVLPRDFRGGTVEIRTGSAQKQ